MKPNQINDYEKSSYANSEMQQLSFLTETMLFILKQYEEEVGYIILGEDAMEGGDYVKLNEKVLLRTDSKTQMETFQMGVNSGIYLINETREKLDMEGVEGGDKPIVNGTMTPLSVVHDKTGTATTAAEQAAQLTKPTNTPAEETPPDGEAEGHNDEQEGGEKKKKK